MIATTDRRPAAALAAAAGPAAAVPHIRDFPMYQDSRGKLDTLREDLARTVAGIRALEAASPPADQDVVEAALSLIAGAEAPPAPGRRLPELLRRRETLEAAITQQEARLRSVVVEVSRQAAEQLAETCADVAADMLRTGRDFLVAVARAKALREQFRRHGFVPETLPGFLASENFFRVAPQEFARFEASAARRGIV